MYIYVCFTSITEYRIYVPVLAPFATTKYYKVGCLVYILLYYYFYILYLCYIYLTLQTKPLRLRVIFLLMFLERWLDKIDVIHILCDYYIYIVYNSPKREFNLIHNLRRCYKDKLYSKNYTAEFYKKKLLNKQTINCSFYRFNNFIISENYTTHYTPYIR